MNEGFYLTTESLLKLGGVTLVDRLVDERVGPMPDISPVRRHFFLPTANLTNLARPAD